MQPALVLRRVAAAAGNFLQLLLAVPVQSDLGADRARDCYSPLELESIQRSPANRILVDQQRPPLVGHHHVQNAPVPQVDQGDGAAVVGVG